MGNANDGESARTVVAVGASAGGVEALSSFVAGLPADLPHAVLVVLHLPIGAASVLARILDRRGPLRARAAVHGAPLQPGVIDVAVPGYHLLVDDGRLVLTDGPTENGHRPAVNALFRSVALAYGPRAVGILLSGVLDDGVHGLGAIHARGGTTVAQSPHDALFADMPHNAIRAGVVDHQLAAAEMGELLGRWTPRLLPDPLDHDPGLELENQIAMAGRFAGGFDAEILGTPSGYSCPDCNGPLVTISDTTYRCRVGHAWTADALLNARDGEIENALWIAVRSLQEKAKLSRRLAEEVPTGMLHDRYTALSEEAEHAITVLGNRLYGVYLRQAQPEG
ncbi:chemotaxis protein CheB [Mycolicibacillus trivialis]|uniref:protein-glutamate methylesterase n=1 Tax=Mycolicibacillus trivialis TaxID=1798 RepID=A0A1X2EKP9_9MYCO|nr:chemotaxis protein CheB [Mycolicibacillus trivialis]ORX05537.1 protein-glutamate methylesterase [Mycolicibacillus trivialis]